MDWVGRIRTCNGRIQSPVCYRLHHDPLMRMTTEGVEPSTFGFVVRRSDPIELRGREGDAPGVGVEPTTLSLTARRTASCATLEYGWGGKWRVRELNPQGSSLGGFRDRCRRQSAGPSNVPRKSKRSRRPRHGPKVVGGGRGRMWPEGIEPSPSGLQPDARPSSCSHGGWELK